jgi:hypothetical protein
MRVGDLLGGVAFLRVPPWDGMGGGGAVYGDVHWFGVSDDGDGGLQGGEFQRPGNRGRWGLRAGGSRNLGVRFSVMNSTQSLYLLNRGSISDRRQ